MKTEKELMKCYICNNTPTSEEHVPAKCFFPKDRRLNLIKLPSCEIHNQNTSIDDEYIRTVIAMTKGAKSIAAEHFRNKGIRSFQRSPALQLRITKNPKFLNLIKDDETTRGLTFEVERERFDKVIKKIAYGLHFHKYKVTWEKELVISTDRLITPSYETDIVAPEIKKFPFIKADTIFEGDNPEIFQYAFIDFLNRTERFVFMKFYEVFEIWALPIQDSTSASL